MSERVMTPDQVIAFRLATVDTSRDDAPQYPSAAWTATQEAARAAAAKER